MERGVSRWVHRVWMKRWTTWNACRYSRAMTAVQSESSPSRKIAAEVRAEMARRGLSARALALKIEGVSYMWVNRRVGLRADQNITLEDLEIIAAALGVTPGKLIADSHWLPRLDSNQQPFGYRTPRKRSRRHPDLTTPAGVIAETRGAA